MEQSKEIEVPTPIGPFKAKGYHFGNMLQALMVCGLAWVAVQQWAAAANDKDEKKEAAKIVAVGQEQVAKSIEKLAEQQRRTNEKLTELTCVMTAPQDRRINVAEFCKRLAKDSQ